MLKMRCEKLIFFLFLLLKNYVTGKQPHIIFIMADDLGWNDVGFHGSLQIPTPNIDALAYSGLILNNYYVQPICTPSRSALMTGLHPVHTGLQHHTIGGPQPYGLPLNLKILPQYLAELGYARRIVGKWHLGLFKKEYTPTYRGFESHYGYWTGRIDYFDHTSYEHLPQAYWGYDFRRDMEIDRSAYGYYTTDLLTDEACSIISNHNNSQPLFMYLAHLAVHSGNPYDPLQAPAESVNQYSYIDDENRRKFAGMLSKLDEGVGKVVQALADASMLEDSIIIFSTDNGGPAAGFNSNAASNWPFRGTKATVWEGGVRGAGLIWSPKIDSSSAGMVSTHMMQIMDWFPTLIAAAGGDPDQLPANDGLNMWPTIVNGSESPRTEMLHNIDPISGQYALRMGDWKITAKTNGGYGDQWDGWFGPSGRNQTIAFGGDNYMINEKSKRVNQLIKVLLKKGKGDRDDPTNRSLMMDTWNSFKEILESATGRAIKKLYPKAFRNMHETRIQSEVLCETVPSNPTQHCDDATNPCLFHIPSDPCEYYDVAADHTDIVVAMMARLAEYNAEVVYPIKVPADPTANPIFWNYAWTNWQDYPTPLVSSALLKKMDSGSSSLRDQN